jgi:hypothetical protein
MEEAMKMTSKEYRKALRKFVERADAAFKALKPPTGDEEARIDRENEATMKRIGAGMPVRVKGRAQC